MVWLGLIVFDCWFCYLCLRLLLVFVVVWVVICALVVVLAGFVGLLYIWWFDLGCCGCLVNRWCAIVVLMLDFLLLVFILCGVLVSGWWFDFGFAVRLR